MGYNIEISFNILKNPNTSQMEKEIISIALANSCNHFHNFYEMENGHIPRNHSIFTTHFDEHKIQNILNFLRDIKKTKGLYIESIYDDEANKLLYASTYYLTTMRKDCANQFKQEKRVRSYSEDELIILNELKHK
jgi:hypothetical protein